MKQLVMPRGMGRGFTLIEVVVAVAIVGAGFAVGLAAISGSLRLMRIAGESEQAMLLARSALLEAVNYPEHDIAPDREQEVYGGVEYGYRTEFRPVRLITEDQARIAPASVSLQQVSVDVYWGGNQARNFRLVTYRLTPVTEATASRTRGPASTAEPSATNDTKDGAAMPRLNTSTAP